MARISSFMVQYSAPGFVPLDATADAYAAIKASNFDLIITQGDPVRADPILAGLSDLHVGELRAQGRTVVGYVNMGVTDSGNEYWNPEWTTTKNDLGPLTGKAPSWLRGQPTNAFGYIVKFWDPEWQKVVIRQAVDLVSRGYSGVFLDDVAIYYAAGLAGGTARIQTLAAQMAKFVVKLGRAIHAVNPDAYIVANADPYMITSIQNQKLRDLYLATVDAQLLENPNAETIRVADQNFAGETRLILRTTDQPPALGHTELWQHGILYETPSYGERGVFTYPATSQGDTLSGGDGPNTIWGIGGSDTLFGHGGNDRLFGGEGNDRILGGDGNDILSGGNGRDVMTGGAGADIFVFQASDSGSTAITSDGITDFNPGEGDRIDVSAIDANTAQDGDQAFTFIGTAAFTAAGQIREFMTAGKHYIALDWNGDMVADMVIRVDGGTAMQAGDFVL